MDDYQDIERLAELFDDKFAIPGVPVRLGLDAILGLLPVVGDAVSAMVSFYIVWRAAQAGISLFTILRMIFNVVVDMVIGVVPVLGDVADIGWRANRKNIRLLQKALRRKSASSEFV